MSVAVSFVDVPPKESGAVGGTMVRVMHSSSSSAEGPVGVGVAICMYRPWTSSDGEVGSFRRWMACSEMEG